MLDINITMDPINDGPDLSSKKVTHEDEGSLVIATNGRAKILNCDDTWEMMSRLSVIAVGDYMGNSDYIAVLNKKRIIKVGGGQYFVGSALLLKSVKGGLTTLIGDEFEKARKEFESRLVKLVCDGWDISAYELVKEG